MLKNVVIYILAVAGILYFIYDSPMIQAKAENKEDVPTKLYGFSLETPIGEISKICKNQNKLLQKILTKKSKADLYRCYTPENVIGTTSARYLNYNPVYINIETNKEKITSLKYVYSNKKLFRIIRSNFEKSYKKFRLPDQFTDGATRVVSYQYPEKWTAYFRIQKNTCIIQIYNLETILGL